MKIDRSLLLPLSIVWLIEWLLSIHIMEFKYDKLKYWQNTHGTKYIAESKISKQTI